MRNRICGRFAKIKIINKARKERKMREVAQGKTSELGWVAMSVARQLATAALWVRIQTFLKIIKGVADTL